MLRPSFDTEDFFNGSKIDGIGGQCIERVCGHSYNGATIQPPCSVANDAWVGIRCADLQYLSGQSKVPNLFWSYGRSDLAEW